MMIFGFFKNYNSERKIKAVDWYIRTQKKKEMLKQVLVISTLAGLPVFNEYAKTYITKTKVFKNTISSVNEELSQINVILRSNSTQASKEQTKINHQEEHLFDLILTPQIEKLLSTKSKTKIEFIRKLRDQQSQNITRNALIMGVHSLGSFAHGPFFYWSAIVYCSLSQLNLINDLFILKTGRKLVNFPFKTVSELYLKVSTVMLVVFSIKTGFRKLADHYQTKQIVKRQP